MDRSLRRIAIGFVAGLFLAYPAAWICGAMMSGPSGLDLEAAERLMADPLKMANPLALPANKGAAIGALIAVAACTLAAIQSTRDMGNFDYGKEYGDSRWATPREMARIADKRRPWNNIKYAKGCELAMRPYTPSQMRQAGASWLNTCVIGTTGAGKLWRYIAPLIMQLVGTRLDYMPWGRPAKDPCELARVEGESTCADMFVIDTKGETLTAFGGLLERAGYDIRVFDGINFDKDRYNPFALIETHSGDVADIAAQSLLVKADFGGGQTVTRRIPLGPDALGDEGLASGEVVRMSPEAGSSRVIEVKTEVFTRDLSPVDGRNSGANPEDVKRRKAMIEQLRGELDGEYVDDKGRTQIDERITEIVRAQKFRRSMVAITVAAKNLSPLPMKASVTLELEAAFERIGVSGTHNGDGNVSASTRTVGETGAQKAELSFDVCPDDEENRPMAIASLYARMRMMRLPDALDLARTADMIVKNLSEPDKPKGDIFWENSERLYLMMLISYMFERYVNPDRRNFSTLMTYLDLSRVDFTGTNISPIDVAFEEWQTGLTFVAEGDEGYGPRARKRRSGYRAMDHGPHPQEVSLAVHCYRAFKQGAPETLQSILISCSTALLSLFPKGIREATSVDEIGIDTLGDPGRPKAVFALVDDQDHTFDFIFALMISQAMTANIRKADASYGGKLPRQVHLVLDELANIATITNLERIISVVRSRNMALHIILQSLNQLTTRYGDHAATIRDNCPQLLFLGGQSEETLKGLEELAGTETIEEVTTSRPNALMGEGTLQKGRHGRSLITIDQLRRLPVDECIVMINHQRPYKGKKVEPAEHPLYPYVYSDYPRPKGAPPPVVTEPFDYTVYRGTRGEPQEAA